MLKSLIDFNYFRTIAIGNDNFMDLIATEDYLQIHVDKVKEFCFNFLQSSIKRNNCLANVDAAAMYRHKLYNNVRVQRFMSKDFSHILLRFQNHIQKQITFLLIIFRPKSKANMRLSMKQ